MSQRTAEAPTPGEEREEAPEEAASFGAASIEGLAAQGDADGLLALARALRAGTGGVARDLGRCLDAYRAAAELGSAEADHAAALFYLAGGVVARDEREAATRLRRAADGGHTPAKVYVANLYELGIHYKADPAKADVWYRNAARSGGVTEEPGTPEHTRAMAELGAVRHCLELVNGEDTSEEDRAYFTRKAKAYGYREPRAAGPTAAPVTATTEPVGLAAAEEAAALSSRPGAPAPASKTTPASSRRAPSEATEARTPEEAKAERKAAPKPSRAQWGTGLTAFLYATVFMAAAIAGGLALLHGAKELLAEGKPVPVVGDRLSLILPILVGAVGVLPALLVYRIGVSARAILLGAVAAGAGAVLWDIPATTLLETRTVQAVAFGAAGFLAALLVLGILGGAKGGDARQARI